MSKGPLDWYVWKFSVNLEILEENIDRLLLLIADNQDKSYLTPYLTACNVWSPWETGIFWHWQFVRQADTVLEKYMDGLVEDCCISIANALELL